MSTCDSAPLASASCPRCPRHARCRVLVALVLSAATAGCARIGYGAPGAEADATVPVDSGAPLCGGGACRRVFVTSQGTASGGFGGLAQADAACQQAADAAGLGGTWLAWLSVGGASAGSRLAHSTVPYRLLDGTVIANDWNDLVDGTLAHPIDLTELGGLSSRSTREVWTGTSAGGSSTGNNCSTWTNTTASMPYGTVGHEYSATATWSSVYEQFCDRTGLGFYCFEQ